MPTSSLRHRRRKPRKEPRNIALKPSVAGASGDNVETQEIGSIPPIPQEPAPRDSPEDAGARRQKYQKLTEPTLEFGGDAEKSEGPTKDAAEPTNEQPAGEAEWKAEDTPENFKVGFQQHDVNVVRWSLDGISLPAKPQRGAVERGEGEGEDAAPKRRRLQARLRTRLRTERKTQRSRMQERRRRQTRSRRRTQRQRRRARQTKMRRLERQRKSRRKKRRRRNE